MAGRVAALAVVLELLEHDVLWAGEGRLVVRRRSDPVSPREATPVESVHGGHHEVHFGPELGWIRLN